MLIVESVEQLDEMIEECDRALAVSDDAMREVFTRFEMVPPSTLPPDPFSDDYRRFQMELYEKISGKSYAVTNEVTKFDIESAVRRPFPYYTASGVTTGEHYMAIGFFLRAMALPPASRILEFGPGWGNTTLTLARMGHHVTAVDVEPRFCELIRRRAEHEGLFINVVNDDFFWLERQNDQFDAVMFFECFHHCADHQRLLRHIGDVVTPDGRLFFGSEPIWNGFPMPWGLRLDGHSLWAIRKNGWMELGFQEDYFKSMLKRNGWSSSVTRSGDVAWSSVWTAWRGDAPVIRLTADNMSLRTEVGERSTDGILLDGRAGVGLFGPYVHLSAGHYIATVNFSKAPLQGLALMDVCIGVGHERLNQRQIHPDVILGNAASLEFELMEDSDGVEVRLFCEDGFTGVVVSIEIAQRS